MTKKTTQDSEKSARAAFEPFGQMQTDALAKMLGLSASWLETMNEMGAEWQAFVARRIDEDVKTQQKILHCKTQSELRDVQVEFMKKAVEQYHAETGKLVEMSFGKMGDHLPNA